MGIPVALIDEGDDERTVGSDGHGGAGLQARADGVDAEGGPERRPVGVVPAGEDARAPRPLMIPPGAVVVPGSRAVTSGRGKELGLSLYTPVIIKYRDEKTDQAVRLEELLR